LPRGVVAAPASDSAVAARVGERYDTLFITSGGCSCDLFRGARDGQPGRDPEAMRRKYQKLGWSAAKIERALASNASHGSSTRRFLGLRADVRDWMACVAERVGEVVVIAHWFGGSVDEAFDVAPGPSVSPRDFRTGNPPVKPDELTSIRAGGHREASNSNRSQRDSYVSRDKYIP
jgi:hypothetical protein